MIEKDIDEILTRLTFSKFRNSFKLKSRFIVYSNKRFRDNKGTY